MMKNKSLQYLPKCIFQAYIVIGHRSFLAIHLPKLTKHIQRKSYNFHLFVDFQTHFPKPYAYADFFEKVLTI